MEEKPIVLDDSATAGNVVVPTQSAISETLRKALAEVNRWLPSTRSIGKSGTVRSGYTKNHSVGTPKKAKKLAVRMRRLNRERNR